MIVIKWVENTHLIIFVRIAACLLVITVSSRPKLSFRKRFSDLNDLMKSWNGKNGNLSSLFYTASMFLSQKTRKQAEYQVVQEDECRGC